VTLDPRLNEPRPFAEFRHSGLLWLLNTTALHPRGFALAFHWDDDADPTTDEPTGWSIIGDGTEPWTMGDHPENDACFAAVERLLNDGRNRK
jgi:hypothetical protein